MVKIMDEVKATREIAAELLETRILEQVQKADLTLEIQPNDDYLTVGIGKGALDEG